jgi:hypothetical protein
MRIITSILFGVLIGVSGTFLHNSYKPFGLIVSLVALMLGLQMTTNVTKSKIYQLAFVVGWVLVIVRASTLGNGGEVLIEANLNGNLFVFGGMAFAFVTLLRKIKS